MADDTSGDVPIEGDEDETSIETASEQVEADPGSEPSTTSVRQGDPSQASVNQPEKSQASVQQPEASQMSMKEAEAEQSQAAVQETEKSQASLKNADAEPEPSQASMKQGEQSQASIKQTQSGKSSRGSLKDGDKSQTSIKQSPSQKSRGSLKDADKSQTSIKQTKSQKSQKSLKDSDQSQMSVNQAEQSQMSVNQAEQSQVSVQQAEQSQMSVNQAEQSQVSVNQAEQSQMSMKQEAGESGEGAQEIGEEGAEAEGEPEPEPEPPRYVEPLGQPTEETLSADLNPWILDKLFHEGKMGRFGHSGQVGQVKLEEGGITTYEDYRWQLEKMFRQVPEDMSLGKVRLKPDELLYEEEKWVLGKMFRDLNEVDYGYMPTAEIQESVVDLCEAIEVSDLPVEPPPCRPPPSLETDSMLEIRPEDKSCSAKIMSSTGKVFEFSYAGIMAVSVESNAQVVPTTCGGTSDAKPVTPFDTQVPIQGLPMKETLSQDPCLANSGSKLAVMRSASNNAPSPVISKKSNVGGRCRNNMHCDSNIKAVCDAARKAMAIYDTVTGCDNFPCNEGDRPEKEYENVEDGVWSWLYQLIFKLTPVDTNQNHLVSIPEEPSNNDDSQASDGMC